MIAIMLAAALSLPVPGEIRWPEGKSAAFYLSFDDGCLSQPKNVFPLLEKYRVPATFYVCPGWDSFKQNTSLWRTDSPYVFLGNHTMTHGAIKSVAAFESEVAACNDAIRTLTGKKGAVAFGIPGTETMNKLLPMATDAEIDAALSRHDLVLRYPYHGYPVDCRTIPEMEAYVDQVLREGGVGHLDFHGVGGDWLDPGLEYFEALLRKLDANRDRLWFTDLVTLRSYVDDPKNRLSPPAGVTFVECPKCSSRFRVAADGESATVNSSRVRPEERETVARRAAAYLARAKYRASGDFACPLMGWSSWNTFGLCISEEVIVGTARAMATNGLKRAGYLYVNVDDGFFWGHGEDGRLVFNRERFPEGLKGTVDGIHALGFKAGIYSDAGSNTCATIYSHDPPFGGSGLYGHDREDCELHFKELGFDFIKVDYCGALKMGLDPKTRYTEIKKALDATGRHIRFNICRWAYPGTWVADVAESWRTTGDIWASWQSVRGIIARNLYLSAYASRGHYNDMDMLEVGRLKGVIKPEFGKNDEGLTAEEERTHFGMWCMMSSPLLIGCDVRKIPASTLSLVTNPYLVAMNQNCGLGVQGYVASRQGETYVIVKDADEIGGLSRYVALYNAADVEQEVRVRAADLDLAGTIEAFDLFERADVGTMDERVYVTLPPHGAKFYRFDAERRLPRTVYEAETAFCTDFQDMRDSKKEGTVFADQIGWASGGVAVVNLGGRPTNDIIWKHVDIAGNRGVRTLEFRVAAPKARSFTVEVDGKCVATREVSNTEGQFVPVAVDIELEPGCHTVRLFNATDAMPDVDVMYVK